MTGELTFNLGTALSLAGWFAILVLAVGAFRWSIRLLPLSSHTRTMLTGSLPLVEMVFGAVYLLVAVERIFRGSPLFGGLALVGVMLFGLWLGGETLRDVLAGVLIRTGGSVGVGDRVRFGGLEGRVTALGYRVLTLDLGAGDESQIPYSQLSRTAILRTPHVFGAHRHSFHLPAGTDAEKVRQTVLLCHWSSVSKPPVIEASDDGLEVTVFALDPEQGPVVESFVRQHALA